MFRFFSSIVFAVLVVAQPVVAKPFVFGTINGYTVVKENRKSCYATIPLLSINGVRVSFTLYLAKGGKSSLLVSYGEGRKPKKRRDRVSVKFDGAEFLSRKVKIDNSGAFKLPTKNRSETARFFKKFAERDRMVVLLQENGDGFALELTRSNDVIKSLGNCLAA